VFRHPYINKVQGGFWGCGGGWGRRDKNIRQKPEEKAGGTILNQFYLKKRNDGEINKTRKDWTKKRKGEVN